MAVRSKFISTAFEVLIDSYEIAIIATFSATFKSRVRF